MVNNIQNPFDSANAALCTQNTASNSEDSPALVKRCSGHVYVYPVQSAFGSHIMNMMEVGSMSLHPLKESNSQYCHRKFIHHKNSILEVVFHIDNSPACKEFQILRCNLNPQICG